MPPPRFTVITTPRALATRVKRGVSITPRRAKRCAEAGSPVGWRANLSALSAVPRSLITVGAMSHSESGHSDMSHNWSAILPPVELTEFLQEIKLQHLDVEVPTVWESL